MKRINRNVIVFVLLHGIVKYCFGRSVTFNYCKTKDCISTANEFDQLIDWSTNRCGDFYKFACGRGPPKKLLLTPYRTQEEYLQHVLDALIAKNTEPNSSTPRNTDVAIVQLIKQYYKTCEDKAMFQRVGLQPIIGFLKQIPSKPSWWTLEKWAVSIGMDSTFFSASIESHLDRKDKKGAIILTSPHTKIFKNNYWDTSNKLIAKLKTAGLQSTLADNLVKGMNMEFKFFQLVAKSKLGWLPGRHYSPRILTPISNWKDFWDKNRTAPSNIKQIDWEMYFEDYWKASVSDNGMIPLLKNGTFSQWMEYPYQTAKFGHELEKLTEEDIKNIIVWRMVQQLAEYAGQDTRTIMELPSDKNCRTLPKNSVLQKDFWSKVFPKPVKKMVRKIYINVNLQIKLLNYKMMIKILPNHEPLTPRESKKLSELQRQQSVVTKKIDYLEREKKNAIQYLAQLEKDAKVTCIPTLNSFTSCREAQRKAAFAKKEIPNVRKRIAHVDATLEAKLNEKTRSTAYLERFEKKNSARMKQYDSKAHIDNKHKALMNYVRYKSYPKFPFEDTFKRLTLITKILPHRLTYVDLALGVKKWERGMLLQPPETFYLDDDDMQFIRHTLPNEAFTRIKRSRPASLNYGALGSVLGNQQMTELSYFDNDRYTNIRHCLKKVSLASIFDRELPYYVDELSNMELGLQAAWIAYKRDAAINGDRKERLVKKVNVRSGNITKLNSDQLFFLSFANANCARVPANALVNDTVKQLPKFYEAFTCATSAMSKLNTCLPNISRPLKPQ